MSMYDTKNFVSDFAYRTSKNLEKIQTYKNDKTTHNKDDVYEVTQLINSFLGLIVFPQQADFFKKITCPKSLLTKIEAGIKENSYTNRRAEVNFANILYHLRNALAHKHIQAKYFEDKEENAEITELTFNDKRHYNGKKEIFEIDISMAVLEELVSEILKELEKKKEIYGVKRKFG